jgi:hypothetical protein
MVRHKDGNEFHTPAICIPVLGATSLSLLTAALPAAEIGSTCAELGHWPVASVALRSEGCCSASFAPSFAALSGTHLRQRRTRRDRANLAGGAALPYSGPRCSGFDSSGSSIQATAFSHSSWDIAINGPQSRAIYRQPKGNVSEPRSSTRSMLPGKRSVSTPSRVRRSRRDEPVIG